MKAKLGIYFQFAILFRKNVHYPTFLPENPTFQPKKEVASLSRAVVASLGKAGVASLGSAAEYPRSAPAQPVPQRGETYTPTW